MSVTWLTLRNHLNAYINKYEFEQNLHQKLTDLQNLMSEGIQGVYDKSQLRDWISNMIHDGTELSRLMKASSANPHFIYEQQELNIKNDMTQISQKLIDLWEVIDVIHIDRLKQLFVFADHESVLEGFALVSHAPPRPTIHHANLAQLFAAFQKLNETA